MEDLYEELGVDQTASLDEIKAKIDALDQDLMQKIGMGTLTEYEAADAASLIRRAREAFSSERARHEYDERLGIRTNDPDPEEMRLQSVKEWYGKASGYADAGEYDLAAGAAREMLTYLRRSDERAVDAYLLAATVFAVEQSCRNADGQFDEAITCANQAILLDDGPASRICRAQIFEKSAGSRWGEKRDVIAEARRDYETAKELAEGRKDDKSKSQALGLLAKSYLQRIPLDVHKAKELAGQALECDPTNEVALTVKTSAEAQEAYIARKREEERLQEEQRAAYLKAEEERRKAEEEARKKAEEERQRSAKHARNMDRGVCAIKIVGRIIAVMCFFLITSIHSSGHSDPEAETASIACSLAIAAVFFIAGLRGDADRGLYGSLKFFLIVKALGGGLVGVVTFPYIATQTGGPWLVFLVLRWAALGIGMFLSGRYDEWLRSYGYDRSNSEEA